MILKIYHKIFKRTTHDYRMYIIRFADTSRDIEQISQIKYNKHGFE